MSSGHASIRPREQKCALVFRTLNKQCGHHKDSENHTFIQHETYLRRAAWWGQRPGPSW